MYTGTTTAQRVVPLDQIIITILTTHIVHLILPLLNLTRDYRLTRHRLGAWFLLQSLSTVGTLRHPISVTSAYLGIPPYPAWGAEHNISLSKEEIEDIFLDLQQKFGFQRGYAVHAGYIGGSTHITASGTLLPCPARSR